MEYELLYKCTHCETFFVEVMSDKDLGERFHNMYETMSDDMMIALFDRGLKFHDCHHNWKSYGKVVAIREKENDKT